MQTTPTHRGWLAALFLSLAPSVVPSVAYGWSDHTLGAYQALAGLPEVKSAPPAKVETIEAFLQAEQQALVPLLKDEETWARQNVPNYPPRPDGLEFKDGGSPQELRTRFLKALRMNPNLKLALFVQPLPEVAQSRPSIPWQEVTILKDSATVARTPFVALKEGESATALEVAATASDEPDYGVDIGVWEDNGTDFGRTYGFGPQPFGNPVLEYSSQAPFHMGYFHEAGIIYKAAGFVKRTFPEYRLHMLQTLARHAFKTGHDYWGWRFTGWGLHYIQDLTQPYHSSLLPGISVPRMLWINTIAMIGVKGPKSRAIQLVTNRHLATENYEYEVLEDAYRRGESSSPVLVALANASKDSSYGPYNDAYARNVLTVESHGRGDKVDEALEEWLPERLVDDPTYIFEQTEPDINVLKVVQAGKPEAQAAMSALLEELMTSFGAHSRNYVRAAKAP